MPRKLICFAVMLFLLLFAAGCGSNANSAPVQSETEQYTDNQSQSSEKENAVGSNEEELPSTEPAESVEGPESYDDIVSLFDGICEGAELSTALDSSRIHVRIKTNWDLTELENWEDLTDDLGIALETADPLAENYGANTVSAEILAADGSVLASGYSGKVQYTAFEERDVEIHEGTTYFDPESVVSESLERANEKLDEVQAGLEERQPADTAEETYVLNTNTMKFHKPSCNSVEDIAAENRSSHTGTRDEVIAMGYVPCKRCHP